MYHVNVKIVMMEHLWCNLFLVGGSGGGGGGNTKMVVTEYSYRLLQCCDPQFRLFDP